MKIIVKNPGQNPHYEWTDNTLKALQNIVGGYIEVVTLAPDLALICNEEGRIYGLPLNEFIDYMEGKHDHDYD